MSASTTAGLAGYVLVPASEAQDLVATQREWVEWGQPLLTQDQFITREKVVLGSTDFSATRRRRWVLVPADDTQTLDFFAGCETYRRPILLKRPGTECVERALSYAICSVFVPENKRRNGYAAKMMTLLQQQLSPDGGVPPSLNEGSIEDSRALVAPLGDAEALSDEGAYGGNATCSFLYSDIDDYYSQFAWKVVGNRHVEWKPSAPGESAPGLPSGARWLQADELPELGRIDRDHLLSLLEQRSEAGTIRFCVEDPEATSWRWLIKRTNFYATTLLPASAPKPDRFALLLPASDETGAEPAYAVWMFDFVARKVAILRLRFASRRAFELLIAAVRSQAAEFGMDKCLAWNIDLPSLGVELTAQDEEQLKQGNHLVRHADALHGGEVVERLGKGASLPALAWYADRSAHERVEWVCNEYGWWC